MLGIAGEGLLAWGKVGQKVKLILDLKSLNEIRKANNFLFGG